MTTLIHGGALSDCVNWRTNTRGDCGGRVFRLSLSGRIVCEACLNRAPVETTAEPVEAPEPPTLVAAARELADKLNRTPCERVAAGQETVSCCARERLDAKGRVRGFAKRDPSRMCDSCAATWHVEIAALILEGVRFG